MTTQGDSQEIKVRAELEAALRRLQELPRPLNEMSDLLNKEISRIEIRLQALNLGISVWFKYDSACAVGYAKFGNQWGLGVRDTSIGQECRLLDAPRQWRLEAAEFIPEMVMEIADRADIVLADLQRQVAELREVLP